MFFYTTKTSLFDYTRKEDYIINFLKNKSIISKLMFFNKLINILSLYSKNNNIFKLEDNLLNYINIRSKILFKYLNLNLKYALYSYFNIFINLSFYKLVFFNKHKYIVKENISNMNILKLRKFLNIKTKKIRFKIKAQNQNFVKSILHQFIFNVKKKKKINNKKLIKNYV